MQSHELAGKVGNGFKIGRTNEDRLSFNEIGVQEGKFDIKMIYVPSCGRRERQKNENRL